MTRSQISQCVSCALFGLSLGLAVSLLLARYWGLL
jgi:hypothetical protein